MIERRERVKSAGTTRLARFWAIALIVLLGGSGIPDQMEHFNGITGMTKKNGVGCFCHNEFPSRATSVWVEGPDTLLAGEEGIYTLSVAKENSKTAGFDLAVLYGRLGVIDSVGTYWYEDELTHVEPKPANGRDTISWQFRYTAPDSSAGLIDTLFSVANSTNQDTMATQEDKWNFGADFPVVVLGTTNAEGDPGNPTTPAGFRLHQNYPNPFNPTTRIRFDLPVKMTVSLTVFDVAGRMVDHRSAGEYAAGSHEIVYGFSGRGMSSGVYFYRIDAGSDGRSPHFSATHKMLLLR